jgi:hypothetical protein
VKVARTVLKGESGGNAAYLLNIEKTSLKSGLYANLFFVD